MARIFEGINKRIERIKLAYSKALTSIGLRVFTHTKKLKELAIKKNVSYGKYRLQKFDVIIPKQSNKNTLPVCFYVHGGSWCGGDKYGYTNFCENISKNNYVVVNINYRLMPKVSIKTCVADCIKAMQYFKHNYHSILSKENLFFDINFNNVFMVGDSAGAHIVSLIAAKKTCEKLKIKMNFSALGLYYGVFNFENISHDPSPIMIDLDKYWKSVYNNTEKLYKEISSTTYVTKNFTPTFMTSGEIDKLHFQSEIMANLLKYNKIDLEYLSFKRTRQDARHAFLNAPFLKSAKEAFSALMDFFEKHNIDK